MLPALLILTPVEAYPPPILTESTVARAPEALIAVAFGRERVGLLIVAVPVVPPITNVVAAPPILSAVTVESKMVPDVFVVVMSPPLIVMSPAVVMLPVSCIVTGKR